MEQPVSIVEEIRRNREKGAARLVSEYRDRLYAAAIVEDAYLESSGMTGLGTGYKMKRTSRLEVDFSLPAGDGNPIDGGTDGVLNAMWMRGGVAEATGFKMHFYQAVAVFEDSSGVTRESAPSAVAAIKCRQIGTRFIIKQQN